MSLPVDRRAASAVAERPTPAGERAAPAASLLRAVTWRSLLVSLFLIPPNAYWIVQMERVRYSAHPTTISLFFNVVFILFFLNYCSFFAVFGLFSGCGFGLVAFGFHFKSDIGFT